jgi:hypothetical protein
MLGTTHIAMTRSVVEALGWPGDRNLVARNAAFPDSAQVIAFEKYGTHLMGYDLAALTHTTRPIGGGLVEGYGWFLDRSVPHIDLSDVKVLPHPEAWGFPVAQHPDLVALEPFAKLVRDLTAKHSSTQADEITYSAGSIMADWAHVCYRTLAKRLMGQMRRQALDVIAGWDFHWAGDGGVPYHAIGCNLDGHQAFEGDMDELYRMMEGSGEIAALLKSLVAADNAPQGLTARMIVEQAATAAVVAPCRLSAYRWFWRPGWKRLVKAAVLRSLTASVKMGKVLMREAA